MNEENNNFSIDVTAETKSLSLPQDELISDNSYVNVLEDIPLPESFSTQVNQPTSLINVLKDIPLPETILYTPTENVKLDIVPPSSSIQLDYSVNVSAEEAYDKAEETEKKLNQMAMGMNELYSQFQKPWLENQNKDNFEERPTTEPTNLIFNDKRDRMSTFPQWA
jgi:hypothetical protein